MTHLFLTGERGVGKSTALRRTLELLGVTPGGFRTYFDPDRQRLYLSPPEIGDFCCLASAVAHMEDGFAVPHPGAFDRVGVAAIRESAPGARVLLFDECGRLERKEKEFQREVLSALDGPVPILGVIKPDRLGSWLAQIKEHPLVELITVTEENRDGLPQQLAARVRDML